MLPASYPRPQRKALPDLLSTLRAGPHFSRLGLTAVGGVALLLPMMLAAQEQEPPKRGPHYVYVVRPTDEDITIDGNVTADEWRAAKPVAGFCITGTDRLVRNQTLMRILYDYEAIYISTTCYEQNMDSLVAQPREFDSDLFSDDSVQWFIDANNDEKTYVHMAVNSVGARQDGQGSGTAWNCEWQAACLTAPIAWSVEAKIPFASLGVEMPQLLDVWGFNVCRRRYAGLDEPEITDWSNTSGNPHSPDLFGHLLFTQVPMPPNMSPFDDLNEKVGGACRVFGDSGYVDASEEAGQKPVVIPYASLLRYQRSLSQATDEKLAELKELHRQNPDIETADYFWRFLRRWEYMTRDLKRSKNINAITYAWAALDIRGMENDIARLYDDAQVLAAQAAEEQPATDDPEANGEPGDETDMDGTDQTDPDNEAPPDGDQQDAGDEDQEIDREE